MFEEISVIVPFSLVKERFVSSTHLNVKKKNVLFCLEGHSTLFLYLRFIVWSLTILWLLYHIITLYICKTYTKLCNHIGLNTWSMYRASDETALFYVHGLSWHDISILTHLVKKKTKIRAKNHLNVKKKQSKKDIICQDRNNKQLFVNRQILIWYVDNPQIYFCYVSHHFFFKYQKEI